MNRCCRIALDADDGRYPFSAHRRKVDELTNPFALDGCRPSTEARLLPIEEHDLARPRFILEPYDKSLIERASYPFQRREARQMLSALQPTDGRDARSHSVCKLALGEAALNSPRDDHPG